MLHFVNDSSGLVIQAVSMPWLSNRMYVQVPSGRFPGVWIAPDHTLYSMDYSTALPVAAKSGEYLDFSVFSRRSDLTFFH